MAYITKLARDADAARQGSICWYIRPSKSIGELLGLAAGFAAMLAMVLAVMATRSITAPIQRAALIAEAISNGDLATDIQVRGRDETARMLQALALMQNKLAQIVDDVRKGSENGPGSAATQRRTSSTTGQWPVQLSWTRLSCIHHF